MGVLQDLVATAADKVLHHSPLATQPFDPARHTQVLLGPPICAVMQAVVQGMGDFMKAHARIEQVVRFKRSQARDLPDDTSEESSSSEECSSSEDDDE
jgi:hypothetical protein